MSNSGIEFSNYIELEIEFDVVYGTGEKLPVYQGTHEVTPKTTEQSLATKNKSVLEDITIKSIPYEEVHNITGITVTIGGI